MTARRTDDELRDEVDGAKVIRHPSAKSTEAKRPKAPVWPLRAYGDQIAVQARPYLVKGLLNRGALSCVYGKPKSGKTFVVLDLALHVAADREWRGRRVRRGRVLYLALEGGEGVLQRIVAAKSKFGHGELPFYILSVPLDLLNGGGKLLEAFVSAKADELGSAFDLIVLDTLSRAAPGGDENSPQTMTSLVAALDRLRAASGAHVLLVHHTPKHSDGLRGHGSLLGALDVAIEVADGAIRVTEARDGPSGDAFGFRLEPVTIGTDEDGDAIVSCIVQELDEAPIRAGKANKAKPPRAPGRVEKVVLQVLDAALGDHGRSAEEAGAVARDIPSHATVVRRETLERQLERYMADSDRAKPGNKRREAWGRALLSLQGDGFLMHADGWYWRPSHSVA